MRLAFDVRSEWRQFLRHLSPQQLTQHWLSLEVLRGYRTLVSIPGRIWRGIDVRWTLRSIWRRVLWICPRMNPRHVSRIIGFVLLGLLMWTGMKMWPRESGTSTAAGAVPITSQVATPVQAGSSSPGLLRERPGPEGPARRAPTLSPAQHAAQRKAALVKAQQDCLQRLKGTEPYESAKSRFDEIDVKVRALRSEDPFRDLPRISVEWIEAKSDLQKIIDEAMNADPDVAAAQAAVKQSKWLR